MQPSIATLATTTDVHGRFKCVAVAFFALMPSAVLANQWTVIEHESSITFSVMAEVPNGDEMQLTTGEFPEWTAAIDIDFDNLEMSSVAVEVDIAAATIRPASLRPELLGPQWLDAEQHPLATFKSERVDQTDDGYNVLGMLTLKGFNAPTSIAFGVTAVGDLVDVQGSMSIDRLAWEVGAPFPSSVVARQVGVSLKLKARHSKPETD